MLSQIANYCLIISRFTIMQNSTSLENTWQVIRLYFGFQTPGANLLDFDDIQLQPKEPEIAYSGIDETRDLKVFILVII